MRKPPTSATGSSFVLALTALTIDAVLVVIFAITGRSSHAEILNVAGVWTTAWPFLLGLALSWFATRAWRSPLSPVWPGIGLWVGTVSIGMILRLAMGSGTAAAFIIVATVSLAVFLLGWRGIAALVRRVWR